MLSTSYHLAREHRTAANFANAADTWIVCPQCEGEGHAYGDHDDISGDVCELCDGEGGTDGEWLCKGCDAVCDGDSGCADCHAENGCDVGAYLWAGAEWKPDPLPVIPVETPEQAAERRERERVSALAQINRACGDGRSFVERMAQRGAA